MEEFRGIVFRDGPTGRRAALVSGPDVWELILTLKGGKARGDEAIAATAELLNLTESQSANWDPLLRRLSLRD